MVRLSAATLISPFIVLGLIACGVVPLFWFMVTSGGFHASQFDASTLGILWFTLKQALLSTGLSLCLGLGVARALARRRFAGRTLLINLFAVPQALPAIVAVLAILAIYGNTGWLANLINVYGLGGIVLVHVFFNAPLAAKLFLNALDGIAPERFKLAEQLLFSDFDVFKLVEWPTLQSAASRIGGLIFLVCAASFIVVLTLGGPGATTLEVAIYQALRMDFDVGRAISLSLLQIILSFSILVLASRTPFRFPAATSLTLLRFRHDGAGLIARIMDFSFVLLAVMIVLPPFIAIGVYGLPYINFSAALLEATAFSIFIGTASAVVCLGLSCSLARNQHHFQRLVSSMGLIVPPAVLATGWFLAVQSFEISVALSLCLIVALNSLMALPFAVAILAEGFASLGVQHQRLCAQLNIKGWSKFRRIDFPALKSAVLHALLLAFVLSLGDLTAITLLGTQGVITLPALTQQQMGHYRSHEAGGTALVLTLLCLCLASVAQFARARDD